MKTMMIKDLSLDENLDRKAMAAVHGGIAMEYKPKLEELYEMLKALPKLVELPGYPSAIDPIVTIPKQPDPRLQ